VNTLPRFASAAPFLCLMVCHLEWPDMGLLQIARAKRPRYMIRLTDLQSPLPLCGPSRQTCENAARATARNGQSLTSAAT
jgi:hypothetical protein